MAQMRHPVVRSIRKLSNREPHQAHYVRTPRLYRRDLIIPGVPDSSPARTLYHRKSCGDSNSSVYNQMYEMWPIGRTPATRNHEDRAHSYSCRQHTSRSQADSSRGSQTGSQ